MELQADKTSRLSVQSVMTLRAKDTCSRKQPSAMDVFLSADFQDRPTVHHHLAEALRHLLLALAAKVDDTSNLSTSAMAGPGPFTASHRA